MNSVSACNMKADRKINAKDQKNISVFLLHYMALFSHWQILRLSQIVL